MADQQEYGAWRRFLQHLEQGVGGVAVHILGAIDDDDAPAPFGRRQPHEGNGIANIVDDDFAAQFSGLGINGARNRTQIGMAAAGYATKDRMGRIEGQTGWSLPEQTAPGRILSGQQKSRETIGERRL